MGKSKKKPKLLKPKIRLKLPPNKRHKSKKDYNRNDTRKIEASDEFD